MNIARIAQEGLEQLEQPGRLIYVDGMGSDQEFNTGQLHTVGVRFAAALTGLGVRPGDRVAVLIPNHPEIAAIYHGISRMGGVVLPILFLLAPPEVRHILADSGASVILTSPEFLGSVQQAAEGLPDVDHIITIEGDAPEGVLSFRELVDAAPDDTPIVDRSEEDLALLIYTGGTTGRPKGVMLSHGNLTFTSDVAAQVSLANVRKAGMDPGQATGISALPLAHAFGVIVSLVGPKVAKLAGVKRGGTTVLLKWFDPEQYFRCIQEYQCRTTAMVPTMMTYLLDHPAGDTHDASSLTLVISSAAPLPVEVLHAFEAKFGCIVLESWGLTEAAPLGTTNRVDARKPGSVGLPYPGIEVAIKDPDAGAELPATDPGEICLRGPNVMQGYWNLPDETAKTIRDGWLHTGDIGYRDEEGFLYVVDRVKNLIIRGGLNIYPRDIEELLHRHEAVLEAAVVGVPDPRFGEEVEAFVVRKAGAEVAEEDLLVFCRESLAKYKTPRRIHFIDALPKSGVGKILHRELREEADRRRQGAGSS